MNAPDIPSNPPDVRRLLAPLISRGVDFVMIGGMAGIARGSSQVTFDLDVAYARDHANLVNLVAALEEIGVSLRGAPAGLPLLLDVKTLERGANFTFETSHGDFDILADIAGISSYEELRSAADEQEITGLPVKVASLDHLIAMKRASNRPKDQSMLEEYLVIAEREAPESEGGDQPP